MSYLLDGLATALELIVTFDEEVFSCTWVSLQVSTIAILLASLVGLPLGFMVATNEFKGKKGLIALINTLMAMPTVVVGLFLFSLISRQGPLGGLGLLFTPTAMIAGQVILALPVITSLSISAIRGLDPRIKITAVALGARPYQVLLSLVREARYSIMAAVIAGYGRIIGEVGSAMLLGGNIKGYTRTISTAIALETSKGEFGLGLALGFILLTVALLINVVLHYLQQRAH